VPTKPFTPLAAELREQWSPEVKEFSEQYTEYLKTELSAQVALGRELKIAREAASLTQPRLAELAMVQQAEISKIERGLGNPTRDTLNRLAEALGLRLTLTPISSAVR